MRGRRLLVLTTVPVLLVPLGQVRSDAGTPPPAVQVTSTSADINTFQFVNDTHQRSTDKSGSDFLGFAEHRAPAKVSDLGGSASAFVSQASIMETPGQPPLPTGPLTDIALSGTSTSGATATGNSPAVPVADSEGTLGVGFSTTVASVPIFFSGTLLTANSDASDSCSSVIVDLTGPVSRHFAAFTGACTSGSPHQRSFAQSFDLPAGAYQLDVDYASEVDDTVPDEAASMSASATALLDLAFFPPTARFTRTLSGFTAHFDGSNSAAGAASRPVVKWQWDFGDGRTATTTSPRVAHTYPASPSIARRYHVTLQVVDSGGAVSPPISHDVLGTAVTLRTSRTPTERTAAGRVAPNRAGHRVDVELAARQGGAFRVVATHHPRLTSSSSYRTSFSRPSAAMCRLTATYPGDPARVASRVVRTFPC